MGMAATTAKIWTLDELHSLPDDGNKYELIHGELFVTPPPTDYHETTAARLTRLLDPFVAANGLGFVYRPRAVMRFQGSEVEPDLMVRTAHPRPEKDWNKAPKPSLIVEILSEYTRRRDRVQKKSLYLEAGVEFWIVDPETRAITVARPGEPDRVEREAMSWTPLGVSATLILGFADIFG
jgi:Uma2 family endonuclease